MKTYAIVYKIRTTSGFMEQVIENYNRKRNAVKRYIDILDMPVSAVDICELKFIQYNKNEIGKDITTQINKWMAD